MLKRVIDIVQYKALSTGISPEVMNRLNTSQEIMRDKYLSVARFGDGELGMILGNNPLGFQRQDELLSRRLHEVLTHPLPGLLLCLPNVFVSIDEMRDEPADFWRSWVVKIKHKLMPILDMSIHYGDSLVTRLYTPWKDRSLEKDILKNLRTTWKGRRLIIVEGEKSRCGVGNDLFTNVMSVERVLCPAKNAWDHYEDILNACLRFPVNDERIVFYLALGPTATVLAHDLCVAGYRALDLGHLDLQYEYMKRGMNEKGIIPGKYNNEVSNGDIVEDIFDKDYESSIVDRILDRE